MTPDVNMEILDLLEREAVRSRYLAQMKVLRAWHEEIAKPRYLAPKRLLRHGYKVYSQNDEDGIIAEIFRRIGVAGRTFVEFGVETGVECNTAKLLVEGWRGLWIEADAQSAGTIRRELAPFIADRSLRSTRAWSPPTSCASSG